MRFRVGIICEMKHFFIKDECINVYKVCNVELGINTLVNYTDCKDVDSFILLNPVNCANILSVVKESNREKLGDTFNREGYYAGLYDDDKFMEYIGSFGGDINKAKKKVLDDWAGYYILEHDMHMKRITNKEYIEKLDNIFGQDNINLNQSKSNLKKYGVFLTDKEYSYNPAIGRYNEIEDIELALITPDKSAILVGEAGVGKTAVVEGLAYKIKNNLVPDKLKNYEIVSINTSSLISGCQYVGMVEERVGKVIDELRKNKKIIMFIDEIHTVIGAGAGNKSNLDVANILKPHLDRGDIKIIGSTTFEEYNNLMLDPAFKRRFKKVNIFEPEEDVLLEILRGAVDWLVKYYGVKFNFNDDEKNTIFSHLLDVTSKECRDSLDKTNNPDLVLSILKEAFANASLYSHEELLLEDIIKSIKNEDRLYESSRERVSLKLIKVFSNNISTDKKLTKVIKLTFNEN